MARKAGLPVVFTCHTRLDKIVHNVPIPGTALKKALAHNLVRRFANSCDAVIAPSPWTEAYLRGQGVRTPVATIPTGIDLEEYARWSPRQIRECRRRYAADGTALLISVCRMQAEKSVGFLLDALARVRERTSAPFRCILVGDGTEKEPLARRVSEAGMGDRILFTGVMEPGELVRAYLASDLFVFASRSETQGMVLGIIISCREVFRVRPGRRR